MVHGYAAVHLQSLCGGYDDGEVGAEAALATENVVELLGAEVGSEARLGDGVVGVAERHACGKEGVAAVGNVGEGAAVHQGRRVFGGLHEVGLHGVEQERHDGAGHAEVAHGEGFAVVGVAQQNLLDAAAQVVLA